jgi:hypothetical protein
MKALGQLVERHVVAAKISQIQIRPVRVLAPREILERESNFEGPSRKLLRFFAPRDRYGGLIRNAYRGRAFYSPWLRPVFIGLRAGNH